MKVKMSRTSGFTLVEIMIVMAILGLLATIAIPSFVRARDGAQKQVCISNLQQIDGAKQQWTLEYKKSGTDTPTADEVRFYVKNSRYPVCPASGTYTIDTVNTDPTCSQSGRGHVLTKP